MKIILYILMILTFSELKCNMSYWQFLNKFPTWDVRDIAFDEFGNIYAGNHGLAKSYDNGLTWENIELDGFEGNIIDRILIKDTYIFIVNRSKLFRSSNEGSNWENITWRVGWPVDNRGWIINKRGHLFIGEYRTTDNGDTWTNEYKGVGEYFSYAMNSEGHIFRGGFGSHETICRSTDDGDTWEVVYEDPNEWPNGYVCETVHNMIFSKTEPVGYACWYKTTNKGQSWYIVEDADLEPSGHTMTLDSIGNIYSFRSAQSLPVYYKYLYKRIKDSTWVPMDTSGLNGVDEFNTMATSPNGYIYLAAHNGGLYRSRDRYVSVPETQEPPGSTTLLSASPNPATDYIEISGINPRFKSWVHETIRIYNALGEIVMSVETQSIASLKRIDVSGLPPGLYFLRLGNITRKFIKI